MIFLVLMVDSMMKCLNDAMILTAIIQKREENVCSIK